MLPHCKKWGVKLIFLVSACDNIDTVLMSPTIIIVMGINNSMLVLANN